jgi:uncharacterized protein YjbI with pentapeptide repeats
MSILAGVIIVSLVVIWAGPKIQLRNQKSRKIDKTQLIDLENKLRQTYSQIIGGIALIVGFFISYNNFVGLKFKQDTEILSNSLNQLFDTTSTTRIGAIYTISRLAEDSDNKRVILEILCDFLSNDSNGTRNQKEANLILNVIGSLFDKIPSKEVHFTIENTKFQRLYLENLNFDMIYFSKCTFENSAIVSTSFENSNFSESKFYQCLMTDNNFKSISAYNAKFISCNLSSSSFIKSNLNSALFSDCDLAKANFESSSLGWLFTPKQIGSYNNFFNDVIKYDKTCIENSNLKDVMSLDRDTAKIVLVNNKEY